MWNLIDAVRVVEEIGDSTSIRDACDEYGISCEKFRGLGDGCVTRRTSSSIRQRRGS